ncbi:MAG: MFS transporter [Pyrinomonadaceae bacterium]
MANDIINYGETTVSRQSLRGLDWLNFFLADVQGGIGPYLAVYLLAVYHWDAAKIGWAMSAAGIAGIVAQTPAGWLVDKLRQKRAFIIAAVALIAASCLSMVFWVTMPGVLTAQIVTGVSGAVVGPTLAAITLGLVGRKQFSRQMGRNQAINHTGNVIAAAAFGFLGYYFSDKYIFYLIVLMSVFTVLAFLRIRKTDIDYDLARGSTEEKSKKTEANISGIGAVLHDKRILIFSAAVILFHFANAAMLPLVGQELAEESARASAAYLSACIITAQIVMIPVTGLAGKYISNWGRKPIFLVAFLALPLRGALYTLSGNPYYLVSVQILDGVAGGIFGVASLIMISDLTSGTGRFNLVQGAIGTATGIGASLSTVAAGYIVKAFGYNTGFLFLAAVAVAALIVFWLFVGETENLDGKDDRKVKLKMAESPA